MATVSQIRAQLDQENARRKAAGQPSISMDAFVRQQGIDPASITPDQPTQGVGEFTGGQAAPVKAPTSGLSPKQAILEMSQRGENFSSLLNQPEYAAAFEEIQRERASNLEAQKNTPEYQQMLADAQRKREADQRRASEAADRRSGGLLGDIARATVGTALLPYHAAQDIPGVREIVNYSPPGMAASATDEALDLLVPGGSGRRGAGIGVGDLLGVGDPQSADQTVYDRRIKPAIEGVKSAAGAIGDALTPSMGDYDLMSSPDDLYKAMADYGNRTLGAGPTGGAVTPMTLPESGGNAQALNRLGQSLGADFQNQTNALLSGQANQLSQQYADAFSRLDEIETDPNQIYDRMLATSLAQASATPGGAAAQRGAQFQTAAQAPQLYAQAEAEVRQNQLAKNAAFNDLTKSLSAQQTQLTQLGLQAADSVFSQNADMQRLGAQLDSSEKMWIGNLARDLQKMAQDNELAWAGLDQNERLARIETELKKYGIDKQFDGIMAGIAAGQQFTWRDLFGGVLGLSQSYMATRG